MADTTASAILNKHLGSRAARVEESSRRLQECRAQHLSGSAPASGAVPCAPARDTSTPSVPAAAVRNLPVTFASPVVLPQGDGSVKVLPGRPVQWLTAKQVASIFGSSESSVYRWIDCGDIPPECVDLIGVRKKRIRADAVERARETWRARRDAA